MPDVISNNIHHRLKDPVYRDKMARQVAGVFIIQDGHSLATFTEACRRNHVELLDLRPSSTTMQEIGLAAAIQNGSTDCIDKLIDMGVNTHHGIGAAFHDCIKHNDLVTFKKLDTNNDAAIKFGKELLSTAASHNHAEAIHHLIKHGAPIEDQIETLIENCTQPAKEPVKIKALEAVLHYILTPNFKRLDAIVERRQRMPHVQGQKNLVHIPEMIKLIDKCKSRCIGLSHVHMLKNNAAQMSKEKAKITCTRLFSLATSKTPQIPPSIAKQFERMDQKKKKNAFWKK